MHVECESYISQSAGYHVAISWRQSQFLLGFFFFNLHTIRKVGTQKRNYWSRYLPTTLESTPYDTLWCLIIILLKWHQHKSCPYACKRPFKSQSLSWSGSSYAHLCLFWVEHNKFTKFTEQTCSGWWEQELANPHQGHVCWQTPTGV